MANSKRPPVTIRLWTENVKTLEPLAEMGLNVSELVNEVLRDNLRDQIGKKIKMLKSALAEV